MSRIANPSQGVVVRCHPTLSAGPVLFFVSQISKKIQTYDHSVCFTHPLLTIDNGGFSIISDLKLFQSYAKPLIDRLKFQCVRVDSAAPARA